jgi:MOSC domain-containing protein YiiM
VTGTLVSVNAAQVDHPVWKHWNDSGTAIDKRPVTGPVRAEALGLVGDAQADLVNHGGPYQALYAYSTEDAAFWAAELSRATPPGAFGENLTTTGVDVSGAVIGERWRVGSVLVEVTAPRIPCRTFAVFWDVPHLVRRFMDAARPGAYMKVVEEGVLQAGDPVTVLSRPAHGMTVADLIRARSGDRSLVPGIREIEDLPPGWRAWVDSLADVKASH